ncbi:polysaccharide deacetylase family protein [Paenibacillus qinlingensis]|uniref:Peptidoglycan/xylan/chitin deacetylase (PgdA/CDA1 family) n=1 Tax=Paenibacillus qinlingensis TaxID=1837343 RepID=A0ABU1NYN0_9BACL|nr:polysaccharide deacetylase family protein [Paenibacillus qinlingensis]MDR6552603.1 peptidoglycan/xylan/chitin deacetylase (PgdA/CDA1 family) [Paenibacillus qinlingensis]
MGQKLAKKMFTMSFDDGTIQDRRFINLIDTYNLKCTFNLNSGFFGQVHTIVHEGIEVCHDEVQASEVKELYKNHEIAVHTVTHPNLLNCSKEKIIEEVNQDYKSLTELSGKTILGMAYPGGPYYNEFTIETILNNTPIRYARNIHSHNSFHLPSNFMEWQPTCHQNDEQLIQLAEKFVEADAHEDMLFYVWGHSFEFDKYKSWDSFEYFCKIISGRKDICYMTNGEVYQYVTKLF